MNIFWAEMLKSLEISSKCSVEAVKSTSLCKFYEVSPGGLGRLVSQNNKTAAMLVFQTSPGGVELFSYVNAFFCSNKFA